jgi:hypothetical protein
LNKTIARFGEAGILCRRVMKMKNLLAVVVLLLLDLHLPLVAGEITPQGQKLAQVLDSMHVEQLWLPSLSVNWRTGEPDGKIDMGKGAHTHCSAFAAAAAEKLGVYLLHPPEHSADLLANAQQDWLRSGGTNFGWHVVNSPQAAQWLANEGQLVVVTCKNSNPDASGHIAIVRPSTKSDAEIQAEGPQIIQAGGHNYTSTNAKLGFKYHPGAFEKGELIYFAHAVSLPEAGERTHMPPRPERLQL